MANENELNENALNAIPFRDSGFVAEIAGLDARIFFVFLTLLFIHTKTVFFLCLGVIAFFYIIRYFRMTPEVFFCWVRFSLGSSRRSWQTKRLLYLRGDLNYYR